MKNRTLTPQQLRWSVFWGTLAALLVAFLIQLVMLALLRPAPVVFPP